MYDKTMFGDDYIELDFDTCQFKYQGFYYTAIIKEIHADHLVVRPISRTNWKDIHETGSDLLIDKMHLPMKSFSEIELEIWMDGRGCDNSAIGVSGCHEPFHVLFRGDPHKIDTPLFKGVA